MEAPESARDCDYGYDCEDERWYSEVDTGRCVRKVDN